MSLSDDVDVPPIMVKCCEAIEKYGLTSQGIYRIGGTMSKVVKLKERLDRGAPWPSVGRCAARACPLGHSVADCSRCRADLDSVNLDADEWSSDISNVTSVLKMWLRELPDPLLTSGLHSAFLDAASE